MVLNSRYVVGCSKYPSYYGNWSDRDKVEDIVFAFGRVVYCGMMICQSAFNNYYKLGY